MRVVGCPCVWGVGGTPAAGAGGGGKGTAEGRGRRANSEAAKTHTSAARPTSALWSSRWPRPTRGSALGHDRIELDGLVDGGFRQLIDHKEEHVKILVHP